MPLYEYKCERHGSFETMLSIAERGKAVCCPVCDGLSQKVFSAPTLRNMAPTMMKAHERNERSRQAPHVCGSGCNHSHAKKPQKQVNEGKKPAFQSYQGKRPWVIEHA